MDASHAGGTHVGFLKRVAQVVANWPPLHAKCRDRIILLLPKNTKVKLVDLRFKLWSRKYFISMK